MIKKWINKGTESINAGALILALSSLISRLLGIFRDRILASKFGAGNSLDIYYASFQVPDFFYNIFILGTLSVAFIPILTYYLHSNKNTEFNDDSLTFTNTIFNMVFICMGIGSIFLIIFTPLLIHLVAPGFIGEKFITTVTTTRIMLISPIIFSLSSILTSILSSFKRFIAISLAPIMYNIGIVLGAIFLVPIFGIYGLSIGVVIGAFFHFLIQIAPVINLGYKYKSIIDFKHESVKKFAKLFFPRIIGIDISQASLLIASVIGSTLSDGSISIYNFANNLQSLPLGLFGISLAGAAFPHLSQSYANNDFEQFGITFYKTTNKILFFIIPSSVFLFILSSPIIEFLLESGKFTQKDVSLTSAAVGIFCISLAAQAVMPLFLRSFYSLHDTITPVIINVFSIGINIVFSLLFTKLLNLNNVLNIFIQNVFNLSSNQDIRVLGIALGFSAAIWINIFILYIILYLRLKKFINTKRIFLSTLKYLAATSFAGIGIYYCLQYLSLNFVNNVLFKLIISILLSGLTGVLIYLLICWILKADEMALIKKVRGDKK